MSAISDPLSSKQYSIKSSSSSSHHSGDKKRKESSSAASASSKHSKKDHSKKNENKTSGIRSWQQDSEFLCIPQFQNTLPNAPSGPFLMKFGMMQSFSELNVYHTSSLEKSYVWQPHFGPDVGIRLDLVDQDSILTPDGSITHLLDHSDLKYLANTSERKRLMENAQDLSWLRQTTYLPGLLHGHATITNIKGEKSGIKKTLLEEHSKKLVGKGSLDPFSIEFIDESFDLIDSTVEALIKTKMEKNSKIELTFSIPILPDINFEKSQFSYVSFDEPVSGQVLHDSQKDIEDVSDVADESVIINIRVSKKSGKYNNNSFISSLVKQKDISMQSEEIMEINDDLKSVHYDWLSDYNMQLQKNESKNESKDYFLFIINEETKQATYTDFVTRLQMKKTSIEDSEPHDALISRRPLLNNIKLQDINGLDNNE